MGQSSSTSACAPHRLSTSSSSSRSRTPPPPLMPDSPSSSSSSSSPSSSSAAPARDFTLDLPDDCLALVFHCLAASDRNRCSLVCRRWLRVDSLSRHRLSLDARASLVGAAPALLARFPSVTKIALKCDRRSTEPLSDEALLAVLSRCPLLHRLKLRSCRLLTPVSLSLVPVHCPLLRKLSCSSLPFPLPTLALVVSSCPLLHDLSLKRLRALSPPDDAAAAAPFPASSALRSVSLKELVNGQSLAPILAASPSLRTLKLIRCTGEWDDVLVQVAAKAPALAELHLEKLQVSDRGLEALAGCPALEILHLVKTPECTDRGLTSVADRCRLLRKIHIDGWKTNRIGDAGLCAVARRCANLQELVLIGVNPTSVSLVLIADNCRGLERLALCSSETFGDAEISCIAARCVALRKLCIKGCPVSDQGMEALAGGCPNLVKVKVKKCRGVTMEGADWLRSSRGSLSVNLDMEGQEAVSVLAVDNLDVGALDGGLLENGAELQMPLLLADNQAAPAGDAGSSSSASSKAGRRAWPRRNFLMAFRRWYHSGSSQQQA